MNNSLKRFVGYFLLLFGGFFLAHNFINPPTFPQSIVPLGNDLKPPLIPTAQPRGIREGGGINRGAQKVPEGATIHETIATQNIPEELDVSAQAAISEIIDPNGNARVLVEKNGDEELPIASITKLMTAIVAVENFDLKEKITVLQEAIGKKGSAGKFSAGETFLVGALLYPLLIESDNDTARVFALKMGEEKFVGLMNQRAAQLGLLRTRYINPTGLDPDGDAELNQSTPRDIARLGVEILQNYPHIFRILSLKNADLYTADGIFHHTATTTNKLFGEILPFEIIGGKTGETPRARKNLFLITRAPLENAYMITVVLGSDDHFIDAENILRALTADKNSLMPN